MLDFSKMGWNDFENNEVTDHKNDPLGKDINDIDREFRMFSEKYFESCDKFGEFFRRTSDDRIRHKLIEIKHDKDKCSIEDLPLIANKIREEIEDIKFQINFIIDNFEFITSDNNVETFWEDFLEGGSEENNLKEMNKILKSFKDK